MSYRPFTFIHYFKKGLQTWNNIIFKGEDIASLQDPCTIERICMITYIKAD